jgi:hypothetical protein
MPPLSECALDYQGWYTLAGRLVGQVLPERLAEFAECYRDPKRKKVDSITYSIGDYFDGYRVRERTGTLPRRVDR